MNVLRRVKKRDRVQLVTQKTNRIFKISGRDVRMAIIPFQAPLDIMGLMRRRGDPSEGLRGLCPEGSTHLYVFDVL
uniref:TH1 domain-containing protein n=1 Tax=Steinernema glaseri TaxID=37863 RepID=A0A1I8ADF0_9BILA